MRTIVTLHTRILLASIFLWSLLTGFGGQKSRAADLESAMTRGDFTEHLANTTAWLNKKMSVVDPGKINEETLSNLLKDPEFLRTLHQRQLVLKTGEDQLKAFVRADKANQTFLIWLLNNTQAMELYLEGAVPVKIAAREQENYKLTVEALDIWKKIFRADPEAKEGMYLRLAIATALRPPGTGNRGAGMAQTPADPVARYLHFKKANQNKELLPGFGQLSVWEYQHVVSSCASDEDLAWAREMINTWRPDLRIDGQVVNSTSEVWYRKSPHPFTDYKSVLSGGGKCGPRSSWAVMICQAFGIPAIGVSQPAHACVAFKVSKPSEQGKSGNLWKVGYGRGWDFSRLEGMSGPEFLAGIDQRSRHDQFSQVEHLRWLASALVSREQAEGVMAVAHKIQQSTPAGKTDLTASTKTAEAEKEVTPQVKTGKVPTRAQQTTIKVAEGTTRIEASAFNAMSGLLVLDCFTGGKQVNFQKNMQNSWIDYPLDVITPGTYQLEMRIAAPNFDQVLDISSGANKLTTIQIPNTTGLWEMTPAADIKLEKGPQILRISAPYQRGVAVRYLGLKPKP